MIPMRPSPKSLTRRPINSAAEPHGRTAAGSLDQNDFVATRRVVDEGVKVLSESRMRAIRTSGCVSSEGWHVQQEKGLPGQELEAP